MLAANPLSRVAASTVCVFVILAGAAVKGQGLCQPRTGITGKECFVSLTGNDANRGTIKRPFRTIAKGVSVVQAGDVLSLRGGVYVESVVIADKRGELSRPIVLRSYPGEQALIDGSLPEFRTLNNDDWERAPRPNDDDDSGPLQPNGRDPHPDEYVSKTTVSSFIRGAFLDRQPYTRLITYSRLEDLRATNETFDKIDKKNASDLRLGPSDVCVTKNGIAKDSEAQDSDDQDIDDQDSGAADSDALDSDAPNSDAPDSDSQDGCVQPADHRYPWVYMGPGIWINPDVKSGSPHRVHIRLSHTNNSIPGLADYRGEVDPRKLRLAISPEPMVTLRIANSSHLRLERLDIRYGGNVTMRVTGATGLVFDHVRVRASSYGVRTKGNKGITFQHSEFDGGKPGWYFRDDGKTKYRFMEKDKTVTNNLGKQTMRSLFVPSPLDTDTTIHHCEFHDAHDLYLGGDNVDFHHNWIHDLNDDGLFLDAFGKKKVLVHDNVVLKTLSALSFASDKKGLVEDVGGPFYIYRNLIDLRERTAGYRPKVVGDPAVWRYGSAFKSGGEDGPYAVFQNTFLVYGQAGQASYTHYRNLKGSHRRRSFNNIFVSVKPDPESTQAITFVPSPSFPAETDGNSYHRIGQATKPPYRFLPYSFENKDYKDGTFRCLDGCKTEESLRKGLLFQQSKIQYPPGYEANSIESDPQFQRIGADGIFRKTDDLRLRWRARGVTLRDVHLRALDGASPGVRPDIGVYRLDSGPLRVGVDGRRSYPTLQ
jgi:Protein of unknown function (DUF1565)